MLLCIIAISYKLGTTLVSIPLQSFPCLSNMQLIHVSSSLQHLEAVAASTGLRINKEDKTKITKLNANNSQMVTLANGSIDEVQEFTLLGSVVSNTGGTDQDFEARLGKARSTFRSMDKYWKSEIIRRTTKVKIFNSSVKAILFYACES